MHIDIRQSLDLNTRHDKWAHVDNHDEAMIAWFDIAEVLTHNGHEDMIPAEWQYRHGQGCHGEDETIFSPEVIGSVMPSEFVRAGNILMRYIHLLDRYGTFS